MCVLLIIKCSNKGQIDIAVSVKALEDQIMRIWNTCKRRQDIKLWLPILEFKRTILQSFDSGGKIGSLMRNNLENTLWALGIRGVLSVWTENWAVLRLPEFSFCCSANHPRNPRGGHSFAENIRSQETEDAACSSSLPCGSLQNTVCSGIKFETQLVFCFLCFLSLLLAVEPSILLFPGRCDLLEAVHPIWASVFASYELLMGNWREKWTSLRVRRSQCLGQEGSRTQRRAYDFRVLPSSEDQLTFSFSVCVLWMFLWQWVWGGWVSPNLDPLYVSVDFKSPASTCLSKVLKDCFGIDPRELSINTPAFLSLRWDSSV